MDFHDGVSTGYREAISFKTIPLDIAEGDGVKRILPRGRIQKSGGSHEFPEHGFEVCQ